ncbi:MAG: helix-turn-helix domain-containing protein [Ruminococcus sp.]|nr:helix-turn-helix domain-containing protein [Ruminococcus sp.]
MELTFGEKIKDARKLKGLTQKQLAEKVGAKHNSISDWENDKNKPDPDTIELLCGVLEITPNYLLTSTSNDFTPIEKSLIKKFRSLDTFGQETLNIILDRELKRIEALAKCNDHIAELERSNFPKNSFTNDTKNKSIHLYSYMNKIACAGTGFYFDDIPTDIIEAPYMEDADFIIGVSGDSMEPTYSDGEKVYVEKRQLIEIGEIGIFMVNNECYIKEAGKDGLISHNPKYELIPGSESIQCIGKVLGKVD